MTWLVRCELPTLQNRHVAVARLKHPANFGRTAKYVKLFVLILVPSKEVSVSLAWGARGGGLVRLRYAGSRIIGELNDSAYQIRFMMMRCRQSAMQQRCVRRHAPCNAGCGCKTRDLAVLTCVLLVVDVILIALL